MFLTYEEAVNSSEKKKWIEAIEEKKCLKENNVWKVVNKKEATGK